MIPTKQTLTLTASLIREHIHRTPVLTSSTFRNQIECSQLFFKAENLQRGGSFKARGACSAMMRIKEDKVCTHSSGNHGTALSMMGQIMNKKAIIVMPDNTPKVKLNSVKRYGGQIVMCESNNTVREQTLARVAMETGAIPIPVQNDWNVIAGQATAAMELYEETGPLDYLIVPVFDSFLNVELGGGGLVSGSLLATKYFSPTTKVIGVEPVLASDGVISLREGRIEPHFPPRTIADGLRTQLVPYTFEIIRENIHDIVTVEEEEIIFATFLIWNTMKLFVETSSATVLAAAIKYKELFKGKRVGVILSGGNVDLDILMKYINKYNDVL